MQSTIDHIEDIISKTGDILETKSELIKLKAAGKISVTVSAIISIIALASIILLAVIILSIGIAWAIGLALDSIPSGFFIMGGVYVVTGIFVYFFRERFIKTPISNLLIDKIIE